MKTSFKTIYSEFFAFFLFLLFSSSVAFIGITLERHENTIKEKNASTEAYIYIPEGTRSVFRYTDIRMYECSWCHRTNNLNRHHIVPQSANPLLTHEITNIIVLCRDCHFVLGHKCNWKKFNPNVFEIVNTYTNTIKSSDYFKEINANDND